MAKEHVHAEEASHICTTLFKDLTHLSELEKTASGLMTQSSEIKPTTDKVVGLISLAWVIRPESVFSVH